MAEAVSAYEQVTRARLEALEEKFQKHEETQAEQFREIRDDLKAIREEINRRLPIWVTAAFTIGGGLIGVLVTAVVSVLRG